MLGSEKNIIGSVHRGKNNNLLNPYYVRSSTSNNCPGLLGNCVPCMLGGERFHTLLSSVGVHWGRGQVTVYGSKDILWGLLKTLWMGCITCPHSQLSREDFSPANQGYRGPTIGWQPYSEKLHYPSRMRVSCSSLINSIIGHIFTKEGYLFLANWTHERLESWLIILLELMWHGVVLQDWKGHMDDGTWNCFELIWPFDPMFVLRLNMDVIYWLWIKCCINNPPFIETFPFACQWAPHC